MSGGSHPVFENTHNVERYTPPEIVEAARRTMGSIEFDPATSETANQEIGAQVIETIEDWGPDPDRWLTLRPDSGPFNMWVNWPFGNRERACNPATCKKKACIKRGYHLDRERPGNQDWALAIVYAYETGIVDQVCCICYANTAEKWIQPLLREYPACWLSPRTNYIDREGRRLKGVQRGSVVFYLGPHLREFGYYFDLDRLGSSCFRLGQVTVPLKRTGDYRTQLESFYESRDDLDYVRAREMVISREERVRVWNRQGRPNFATWLLETRRIL